MTAPRETGGEGRGDVWENPDPKRLKAAPHTMDDEALASLVEIFAEDHPYVGVQMGMWEAASRLRRYAATPRETGAEGREAVRLIRSALYRLAEIDAGPNDDFRREWRRICTHYDDILERALATPRPVEVTEGMVEAALEYERSTYQQGAVENNLDSPFVQKEARKFYRGILTAALRAQPAGGTPSFVLRTDEVEQFAFQCGTSEDTIRRIELEVLTRYKTATGPRAHEVQGGPALVADAGGTP